ncbi:MAG: hypothetical protein U5K00_00740 [Melioribacteraceae bacterium]|nr:hypothetical protein [Melioribacteraceae bacterium]
MEFPVLDIDNNVVAIIGVSQVDKSSVGSNASSKFDPYEILTQLNIPFFTTDSAGKVLKTTPLINQYLPNIEKLTSNVITEIVQEEYLTESLKEFYENTNY